MVRRGDNGSGALRPSLATDYNGRMEPRRTTVSVIVTVRNEIGTIGPLLDSLAGQTRPPDEVVVVDGGSDDGTLEALRARAAAGDLPLTVLHRPGTNISEGRNAAIAAASHPAIAVTDAGVRLPPEWLAELASALERGAGVAAGFFASDPRGAFETALGATTLPEAPEIRPERFLPSSRSVAFWKADWARVGGYPEWLDFGEDLVFDMRLLDRTGPAAFVPAACVRFRPRPGLRAFARQYYRYARGDGKAGLWPRRHAVRYATYVVLVPALVWLGLRAHPAFLLGLPAGLGAMIARSCARLTRQWDALGRVGRLAACLWVPVIRVVGDVAKMVGYPPGVLWRIRHRPPAWRPAPGVGRGAT